MLTPSSDEDSGFLSPLPLPQSFLPSQEQFLNVENTKANDRVSNSKRTKKLPTLEELSSAIRRQNPEKYDTSLASLQTTTSTLNLSHVQAPRLSNTESIQEESDPSSTRRRASISLANALVRRQSTDSGVPQMGVSLARRGSGLVPTLANLGERLLDKRALEKKEEIKKEELMNASNKMDGEQEENVENVEMSVVTNSLIPSNMILLPPSNDNPKQSSFSNAPSPSVEKESVSVQVIVPTTSTSSPSTSHPLQDRWTFYFSPTSAILESTDQESDLRTISEVSTLENFGPLFNHLKRPSQLATNASIYLFKNDVKPNIDHEANKKGGKFVLKIKGDPDAILLDRCWTWLVLALVGNSLEDETNNVLGAVASIRPTFSNPRSPLLSIWLKYSSVASITSINSIGTRILILLELDDLNMDHQIQFDFVPHSIPSTNTVGEDDKKLAVPFLSVNTYKKLSSGITGASSGWRDRASSNGGKGGIVGGVLGSAIANKSSGSVEKGDWRK